MDVPGGKDAPRMYDDAPLSLEHFYWRRHQEAATKGVS